MTYQPPIILDTPDQIQMFALLQSAYRLSLEINTGLKYRQSTLSALRRAGITDKRTKRGALLDLISVIQVLNPSYEISPTLQSALDK